MSILQSAPKFDACNFLMTSNRTLVKSLLPAVHAHGIYHGRVARGRTRAFEMGGAFYVVLSVGTRQTVVIGPQAIGYF